jgi:hypothetical protein
VDKLKEVGFIPSEIYEFLFYKGKSVFVLYTDDSILPGPDPQELGDNCPRYEGSGTEPHS